MINFGPPSEGVRAQLPCGGKLEEEIGKPRAEWTVEDLITVFRHMQLKLLCLMHVGGDGQLRVLDFAPSSDSHLREILLFGERCDGSSIFKGLGIDSRRSDIVLRPRIETALIEPFSNIPALAVLCGHYGRNGKLLPVSPSTIVRRAAERFQQETGAELWSLGEVEYFVGSDVTTAFQIHELNNHHWAEEGGYHAVSPTALFVDLRREAISTLSDIGVPVKYAHGEVGLISPSEQTNGMTWEQHEIELGLAPLVEAADALVLTQWVVSSLAKQMHLAISFQPMLLRGHAGSGLHQHMSVVRNGVHLPHINGEDGSFSDSTSWLVTGLLELGGALMSVGNRTEESFVRLTQGNEAPKGVFWGYFNRGSMIRLPVQVVKGENDAVEVVTPATVEYRLGDGSAFPHLLLAGIAQAATFGVSLPRKVRMNRIVAGAASESDARAVANDNLAPAANNASHSPTPVPLSMPEVANELEKCQDQLCAADVFPEETMNTIRATLLKST